MLTNIPVWASVLLFVLLSLGILQSRPRDVSAGRVSGIALAMCGVSLYGVVSAFGAAAASLLPWLLGLAGAATVGQQWLVPRGIRRARAQGGIVVPGSWIPLVLMQGIFAVKFALGFVAGIGAPVRPHTLPALLACPVLGVLSGGFLARALVVAGVARHGSPQA